jgi:hypothetical protein
MGVHADALPSPPLSLPPSLPPSPLSLSPLYCPHGRENKIKIKIKNLFLFLQLFLVVVAGLEREKKFTIYNFRFSIPKIPKLPKLPELPELYGLRRRSHEKKKVFWPSSPGHPSKLYSSLGWLNSKVPKPFPPFSLRLIDVDGF